MPIEILEDLFFIERGYLNGNHFVYRGTDPVLIDTGYVSDFSDTAKIINDLGVGLSSVHTIINTHTHCDHIGGNRYIQDASGCKIALHRIGKYFIDTRDDWATWWKYYRQQASFFDCSISLEDGDVIAFGPHRFEVLYTPGHASDGIVLYHREEKILLSSDTLWENDMAVMTVRVEGSCALFRHMASLDRLSTLDIKKAYPGHGPSFTHVDEALSRAIKRVQLFLKEREKVADDLLKKIIIYTLLMDRFVDEARFFDQLMTTHWFKETVDSYFDGAYEEKYKDILQRLMKRNLVIRKRGQLVTTVKP